MKLSRTHLLAACAVSTIAATAAQAQVALPTVELRGAGATAPGDITVRSMNCVGNPGNHVAGDTVNNRVNKYGTNSGSLSTIAPGSYNPLTPSATNPVLNCETQEIQPNFEGKYIGVGSGGGREMWRTFQTATTLDGTAGKINPFTGAGAPSTWSNVQFALSEAPAAVSDITAYNANANSVANKAGAAIQFPLFVVPVAFAYNPAYGLKATGGAPVELNFNVKVPAKINNVVSGGLKLSRVAYCKIFNGEITNWNDASLKTLNANTALFDVSDDTLARWNAEGAPIRLVGRADRSGTTDAFTRALAAQCDGGQVAVNKYDKAAESLPYNNTSVIDIRRLRPDTRYFPTSAASNFSGPVQSLGGLVYDRQTNTICAWNEVANSGANATKCDTSLAPGGVFTNAPTPGLFMVADGSSGVAAAIEATAGNALLPSTTAGITLNGKFGYVGADFVKPTPNRNLHAAALQKGNLPTGTAYVMPSAANAGLAFGSVFPPQAIASSGAFNTTDPRTLGSVDPYLAIDPVTNPATPVARANPLHWGAVIYNPNVAVTATLASPANGYPVTAASFAMTYTCFKPANPLVPGNNAKRFGIAEYVGLLFGKVTKNSANTAVNANTFKGTSPTSPGILAQANVNVPPAGWAGAIWESFFKKSTQSSNGVVLGTLNGGNGAGNGLWIQDNLPTTLSDVDAAVQATDQKSNPVCNANLGA